MLGGKLSVESVYGVGSTFTFSLKSGIEKADYLNKAVMDESG
jgi:signal transduction histidine kinase